MVRNSPVMEIANSRISGSMSFENCCTDHRAVITAAPPKSEEDADEHHDRGDVENVEGERRNRCSQRKAAQRNAKNKGAIDFLIVGGALKAYPAKRKGKCNGGGEYASPGEKPVGRPAQMGAAIDEALQNDGIPGDTQPGGQDCVGACAVQGRSSNRETSRAGSEDGAATWRSDSRDQTRRAPMAPA